MSITVLNIMEQVGSRQTGKIVQYINDALTEIADLVPDTIERSTIDIEADTELYNLPSTMKKLLGVYHLVDSDNSIYRRIPEIQNLDLLKEVSASSTTDDDNMIII